MTRYVIAAIVFWCLATVPFLADYFDQSYLISLTTRIMIFALAAVTLDFILGIGGLVSLGHAAFIGIGTYTVAIFSKYGVTDLLVIIPVAVLASGLFALITGALALKTRGINFIMITLAFAQMLYFGTTSFSALGGDDGFSLSMRGTVFGMPLLDNHLGLFWTSFVLLALTYVIFQTLALSSFGRALGALKQNSEKMESLGVGRRQLQLRAYVISGSLCAISGVLLANLSGFVSPSSLAWQRSGDLVIMSVVGGQGTIIGAVIGAIGFLGLEEYLSQLIEYWRLILGPIAILIALFLNHSAGSSRRHG
ncbi:MAG TPA: branched-chain amino acid ABC transporter permease [Aestuariivirgaceae bacterium]